MSSRDLAAGMRELLHAVEREQARLNQLDAIAGDGDHGATVVMGLRAVVASLPADPDVPAAALLRLAAERFASVGGSTGPLWGTALLRAAQNLESSQSTDLAALAGAAEAAAAGIAMRGRCEEGDKTCSTSWRPWRGRCGPPPRRVRRPRRQPSGLVPPPPKGSRERGS